MREQAEAGRHGGDGRNPLDHPRTIPCQCGNRIKAPERGLRWAQLR
jgi:hypothetical protein